MSAHITRYLLAATVVGALFAGSLTPTVASPGAGPTELYFPWVPWGVMIDGIDGSVDAGPFFASLTIQNLENQTINVRYEPTEVYAPGGSPHSLSSSISVNRSQTFNADDIFGSLGPGDVFGGGISVIATKQSDDSPARIAGVLRQMSPEPPTFDGSATSDHVTVSGYTALTSVGIDGEVYLPIAQTNNNWNTLIRATNYDQTDDANITVHLFEANGGGVIGPFSSLTPPGKTATFDLHDLGIPDGWVGSATITAGFPIGAIAERVKTETNMLLMNVARSSDQGSETNHAALIFRDWNSWNTGISISNLSMFENDVTVDFFDADGNPVHNEAMTLAEKGMSFIYLPAEDGSPFIGSAIISGSEPFHGVVDEVKYLGDQPDTGHAMSYTLDYLTDDDRRGLAVPLFRKSGAGSGDTSGIQIFNPGNSSVDVVIDFFTSSGANTHYVLVTIGAKESYTAYSLYYPELDDGFQGHAVVANVTDGPPSSIVAVSNLVNYDVQYDGSASYNAIRFDYTPKATVAGVDD